MFNEFLYSFSKPVVIQIPVIPAPFVPVVFVPAETYSHNVSFLIMNIERSFIAKPNKF